MRKTLLALVLLAGCHAHQVAQDRESMKTPERKNQVSSEHPVRTTPGSMLDAQSMKKIQGKLGVSQSGELDEKTQAALKAYQKKHEQPATGLPDYDTVRRLGLDPKDIYLGGTQRRDAERKSTQR